MASSESNVTLNQTWLSTWKCVWTFECVVTLFVIVGCYE